MQEVWRQNLSGNFIFSHFQFEYKNAFQKDAYRPLQWPPLDVSTIGISPRPWTDIRFWKHYLPLRSVKTVYLVWCILRWQLWLTMVRSNWVTDVLLQSRHIKYVRWDGGWPEVDLTGSSTHFRLDDGWPDVDLNGSNTHFRLDRGWRDVNLTGSNTHFRWTHPKFYYVDPPLRT